MKLPEICFITDRTYCTLSPADMIETVLTEGVRFVQYRDKTATRRELYEHALHLRRITQRFGALFIVNDHVDIALAVEADGVHLGQDDFPLDAARRLMGMKIIGVSTHDLQQAKDAEEGGADYIGFGPVFPTTTKDAGAPRGVDNLRVITENVSIPVVAIGGIACEALAPVFGAGAASVAVASALCRGDLKENTRLFVERIRQIRAI